MDKLINTQELERELRATLSAQREIGPNYDHHLVESFMQRVNQQGITPPIYQPVPPPPPPPHVTAAMRLALAIVSIIFLIPLAAIATHSGLFALVVVGLVVLGINFAFNRGHAFR